MQVHMTNPLTGCPPLAISGIINTKHTSTIASTTGVSKRDFETSAVGEGETAGTGGVESSGSLLHSFFVAGIGAFYFTEEGA